MPHAKFQENFYDPINSLNKETFSSEICVLYKYPVRTNVFMAQVWSVVPYLNQSSQPHLKKYSNLHKQIVGEQLISNQLGKGEYLYRSEQFYMKSEVSCLKLNNGFKYTDNLLVKVCQPYFSSCFRLTSSFASSF